MSDHEKSSRPGREALFRSMSLAMAPAAEAAALRTVGDMLYTYILECSRTDFRWAPRLLGMVDDLEAAAVMLDAYFQENELPALRHPVADWTRRLRELAAEVRAAVEERANEE